MKVKEVLWIIHSIRMKGSNFNPVYKIVRFYSLKESAKIFAAVVYGI